MGGFIAGAAQTNITPPLGIALSGVYWPRYAKDVHDELHAKAIAVSDGKTKLALVVCDLIAMTRDRMDAAKARAEELCGIPASNILIACTHTHTGPAPCWVLGVPPESEYMDWAVPKIADAVAMAARRMVPARAGTAAGSLPGQVFNRRWWMKDGSVKMNPGYAHPDLVRPAGPTDPQMPVLAIETAEGRPLALLANYALHYVGAGASDTVSADYFACFGQAMRRMAGADFLALMANGCSGDINNCNYGQPAPPAPRDPWDRARRVADICATEAYRVWRETIAPAAEVPLGVASREVMVHKRHMPAEVIRAAKERAAQGPRDQSDVEYFWAWQKTLVHEMPDTFPTLLQAMRIGDVGIVGLPGEIFVEIGVQIKAGSPAPVTMPIELANGYLGYTCTDKALKEGSYETEIATSSLPAAGTEGLYVQTATELLQSLWRE